MLFVSQVIINVKQITQCYSIYLTFVKIKIQYYLTNFNLLYLYNFSRIANFNIFTIVFFLKNQLLIFYRKYSIFNYVRDKKNRIL